MGIDCCLAGGKVHARAQVMGAGPETAGVKVRPARVRMLGVGPSLAGGEGKPAASYLWAPVTAWRLARRPGGGGSAGAATGMAAGKMSRGGVHAAAPMWSV